MSSQGVRQALAYAFEGTCDASVQATSGGVDALERYADADHAVARFTVVDGSIAQDQLDAAQLRVWLNGDDPATGQHRGRRLQSPDADLVLDGTINAPKSFSIAALLHPELAKEFEALQDRLRDRILTTWQRELNARRGTGGRVRERLSRIEVVELRHRRSRALDPHIHRHLWLNVKVQGADGEWSNVDSRVAMKLHTVINAEGELAARTDSVWVAELARHGYTLDEDGEIAQLAHLVRPLSRRANQVDANRAVKLAQWRDEHPGAHPGPAVLQAIDRWAWAQGRPDKPAAFSEAEWEALVLEETRELNAQITTRPTPSRGVVAVGDLDRDLLAARAVTEADQRAAVTRGRFSVWDVRAGAMRAIAGTGVVADRIVLEEVIEDVAARALAQTVDLLTDESDIPQHIKGRMSTVTARLKLELAERFDTLNTPGEPVPLRVVEEAARSTLDEQSLGADQVAAAAAIAATDRLVTVTGPAGSGKTRMLTVANRILQDQGRRMMLVAPTRKAATVAGRETAAEATSVHALLVDHGWRYETDAAGRTVWTQLAPGDLDQYTGRLYDGPRRWPLGPGDRVVVDEARMLDLNAARALAIVAEQTDAGIAMVGDDRQARPVGHSGAMATMRRRSGRTVELTDIHRFTDPAYARLTLRLRDPRGIDDARQIAEDLADLRLMVRVRYAHEVVEHMVDRYFDHAGRGEKVALVVATNAEAQAINEGIQQQRITRGQLNTQKVVIGREGQRLLVGDVVQTRRNDKAADVQNRALWTIQDITAHVVRLASVVDSGDVREVTRDYCAEEMHLSYASTVHGVQGETTHASVVGPGVDAAGLYVGMTRGRAHNEVVTIARTDAAAKEQLAQMMLRGLPEVSVDDGRRAAAAELRRAATNPPPAETSRQPATKSSDHPAQSNLPNDERTKAADQASRKLAELEVRIARLDARAHTVSRDRVRRERLEQLHALRAVLASRISRTQPGGEENGRVIAPERHREQAGPFIGRRVESRGLLR